MTKAPAASPGRPDPSIGILLREPFLAFSAELLRRLNDAGYDDLRAAHLVIFQHIDPDGSRVTELAKKAQMAKPSIAYLVEHLEDRGYMERVVDPNDRRARIVMLTDRGWRQIRDALDIIAAMEAELAVAIGPSAMRRLRTLLSQIDQSAQQWLVPEP